jgi:predicted transcriptional regulator
VVELGRGPGSRKMVVWHGMVKVTFTLDDETVARLRRTATRLVKPQSQVVRDAIKEYEARAERPSDDERRRMLAALDAHLATRPTRSHRDVGAELRHIRASRRRWTRRRRTPA